MAPAHRFLPPRIRCREIGEPDLDGVLDLLAKSPFGRSREFWADALHRLGAHPTPPGYPKYGYALQVNGVIAGVLLVIAASVLVDGRPAVRCNVSSWYVWPPFSAYGSFLAARAMQRKDATYTDISPLSHTFASIEAQGFRRYCDGRFIAIPALKLWSRLAARVVTAEAALHPGPDLPAEEIALLLDHAAYGYISLIVTSGGRRYPFVFEPATSFRVLHAAYLVYARSVEDFVRFAGPIGRYLARRGMLIVTLDANSRVPGLNGWYREATPKYYKGPHRPSFTDVAYSERVVLGLRFPARVAPEEPPGDGDRTADVT